MRNAPGFTLIESAVAVGIAAVMALCVGAGIVYAVRSGKFLVLTGTAENDLARAARHIRRVGRVARICVRQNTLADPILECQVDLPGETNPLSQVRFRIQPEGLVFEVFQPGTNTWLRRQTFGTIQTFRVCDHYSPTDYFSAN